MTRITIAIATMLLMTLPPAARAASISYGVSTLSGATTPQFNPALGTLDRVDATFSGHFFLGPITLAPRQPPGELVSGTYTATPRLEVFAPGFATPAATFAASPVAGAWSTISSQFTIDGAFTIAASAPASSRLVGTAPLQTPIYFGASFTPTDYTYTFDLTSGFLADGTGVLTYIYTPAGTIPGPTSAILLGLGLAGVAITLRPRSPGRSPAPIRTATAPCRRAASPSGPDPGPTR